jgi:hypothetical protein
MASLNTLPRRRISTGDEFGALIAKSKVAVRGREQQQKKDTKL